MEKLLSVIVPSYNMEDYLPKCLGSLIIDDDDLLRSLDVIVVNDGSTDRTSAIAHEFERKYPDVFRVIDKANGHYGSCVNAALSVASGRYVKMLDADDSYETDNLRQFLMFLRDRAVPNDVDLCVVDFEIVDPEGHIENVDSFSIGDGVYALDELPTRMYHAMAIHTVAIKNGIFQSLHYRQTEGIPYTDLEMVFRPLFKVERVMCFNRPVVKYLLGREGQSFDPKMQKRDCMKRVQVIMRHVRDYVEHQDEIVPTARKYAAGRLLNRLHLAYYSMLGARCDFSLLDDLLREQLPDFYQKCGELVVSRFSFHFVKEWRRCHGYGTFMFWLYFLVQRLRGKL